MEIFSALETCDQPIIVELCRRQKNLSFSDIQLKNCFVKYSDSCTQTDCSQVWANIQIKRRPKSGVSTFNDCRDESNKTRNLFDENLNERNDRNQSAIQKISDISLEREMALLDREMQSIRLDCNSLLNKSKSNRSHSFKNNLLLNCGHSRDSSLQNEFRFADSSSRSLSQQKRKSVERWIKDIPLSNAHFNDKNDNIYKTISFDDSSSAYNTGESSRSTPPLLELTFHVISSEQKERPVLFSVFNDNKMVNKSTQFNDSDLMSSEWRRYTKTEKREGIQTEHCLAIKNNQQKQGSKGTNIEIDDKSKQTSRHSMADTFSSFNVHSTDISVSLHFLRLLPIMKSKIVFQIKCVRNLRLIHNKMSGKLSEGQTVPDISPADPFATNF